MKLPFSYYYYGFANQTSSFPREQPSGVLKDQCIPIHLQHHQTVHLSKADKKRTN